MLRGPVDRAAFERALRGMQKERAARARVAARRLRTLVAARLRVSRREKMHLISIHLEKWQIEAAKLVAERDGGSYQERIRQWVVAGIQAEASRDGRREG